MQKKNKVASGKDFEKSIQDALIKAEQDNLVKLNEIALALGEEEDVDRISGKSYMDLAEKIIAYIEKIRRPSNVNVKLTMDYKDEWVELSRKPGNIEKYISGTDPKLRFTAYEIDNNKDKRPVATSKPVTASPFGAPAMDLSNPTVKATPIFGTGGSSTTAPSDFNQPAAAPVMTQKEIDDMPF